MKNVAAALLAVVPCLVLASEPSPYAGQEDRSIKSLSAEEIVSLRRGDGMGFAKLAELNHFPGPRHVLDVADELGLSSQQLEATRTLYEEMRQSAVSLGEEIIAAESRLNLQFEEGTVDAESLESALMQIGKLRARLRNVHLRAHLSQAELLEPEQIRRYDVVRGYRDGPDAHGEHHNLHQ